MVKKEDKYYGIILPLAVEEGTEYGFTKTDEQDSVL